MPLNAALTGHQLKSATSSRQYPNVRLPAFCQPESNSRYVLGTLHEAVFPVTETFPRFSAYCPAEAFGDGNRIQPYRWPGLVRRQVAGPRRICPRGRHLHWAPASRLEGQRYAVSPPGGFRFVCAGSNGNRLASRDIAPGQRLLCLASPMVSAWRFSTCSASSRFSPTSWESRPTSRVFLLSEETSNMLCS